MLQIRVVQRPTLEVLVRYKEGFTNEIVNFDFKSSVGKEIFYKMDYIFRNT